MSNQNKVILGNMPSLPYAIEEAVNRLRQTVDKAPSCEGAFLVS